MRQRPTSEPASQSPQANSGLNPILQAALSNFDVQLEEELARYRRQRTGRTAPPTRGFKRNPRRALDLITVSTTNDHPTATVPQPSETSPTVTPLGAASRPAISSEWQAQSTAIPDLWSSEAPAEFFSENNPLTSQLALTSAGAPTDLASGAAHTHHLAHHQNEPDSYLESSEELLRSLAEEEAEQRVERGFVDSLLTPLGVGSMLLLLLSSATFGYVIMNPASLSHLDISRLFASRDATSTNSDPSSLALNNPATPPEPKSPNLAVQEFPSLDLTDLSTLKASSAKPSVPLNSPVMAAKPIPAKVQNSVPQTAPSLAPPAPVSRTVSPAPANQSRPRNYSRSAPPPVAPRAVSPPPALPPVRVAPTYVKPQPQSYREPTPLPAPSSSPQQAPSPRAMGSGDSPYKVVVEYSGDRALAEAKQAAPDAYVRQFPQGAQIQLGAYGNEDAARERVQQLQQQGIPAKVYQPE